MEILQDYFQGNAANIDKESVSSSIVWFSEIVFFVPKWLMSDWQIDTIIENWEIDKTVVIL